MAKQILTQERLKELVIYNQHTGEFTTKQARGNLSSGAIAGYEAPDGYVAIKIDGIRYLAHRLIFLYMENNCPVQVDHINHVRNDNRWINLRVADHTINQRNTRKRKTNKSGVIGVYWNRHAKRYYAQISVESRNIFLGGYHIFENAVKARKLAEIKHGYHENHGVEVVASLKRA